MSSSQIALISWRGAGSIDVMRVDNCPSSIARRTHMVDTPDPISTYRRGVMRRTKL
jgi:hypothetical protein